MPTTVHATSSRGDEEKSAVNSTYVQYILMVWSKQLMWCTYHVIKEKFIPKWWQLTWNYWVFSYTGRKNDFERANSDAKIMFQKAKSKRSVNIHHTKIVLQKNNISSISFLLNMMEGILFYMTKTLKQETLTGEHFCSLRYHKHRDKKSHHFFFKWKKKIIIFKSSWRNSAFLSESVYQRISYSKQTIPPLLWME